MLKLYEGGAYLVNGNELIPDTADALAAVESKTGVKTTKEEAAKGTMAYGILSSHNTSGNMENLKIKFDKLTSHDITFVGILQTARASGLEKFPVPYVLTNCHNSLCAVGGTTSSGSNPSVCKRDAGSRRRDDPWIRQPYPLWCIGNHGSRRRRTRDRKTAFGADI